MKLKAIKAFGFKTFAEPTSLEFGEGITAIVGPNGSGKSNLVDAFRWALGEQSSKSIRSGRMEDVIFAGNEKRKPLGLAEVSVIFDNGDRRLPIDFAEVEIARRAYRAGEIEYYINRNQCRLRDVMDLLMGSGLGPGGSSIVSQGQIDAVLTSKPVDRRALFEEAAGIAKFLARKHESMRRLDQTEQNAIRINDLLAELERRIPELDTQVRRAKRYRKLSTRVRDLEILSYIRASQSRRTEREALKSQLERNEEARAVAGSRAASLGAHLAAARTSVYRCELELEEGRTQSQARRTELAAAEAEYAAAAARKEALEAQSTQTSQDADRSEQERSALTESIEDLGGRIAGLERELDVSRAEEQRAYDELVAARCDLDEIFAQLRDVQARAGAAGEQRAKLRAQAESAHGEAERLDDESSQALALCERLEIDAGAATRKFEEHERQLASLETQTIEARARLEEAHRAVLQAHEDLARATAEHREYSSEVAAAQSRLHTIEEMENAMEGHVPGTRAAVEAWQRGELSGIEGIISNLIAVDEPYARALDVAFGARLSNIVTRTSEDAERAIRYLTVKELGRATFLPLDTLGERSGKDLSRELRGLRGVIGYAHTLVKTQEKYAGALRFLVGAVLVVDTLERGIDLVRNRGLRDTIVTLSGEQIAGGGAITGGRYKRERSILSRRVHAQQLREQLAPMRNRLSELDARLQASADIAQQANAARESAAQALSRTELSLAGVRGEIAGLRADAERMRGEMHAARARASELHQFAVAARERERDLLVQSPEEWDAEEARRDCESDLQAVRERITNAEDVHRRAAARAADLRERRAALIAEREGAQSRLGIIDEDSERARDARLQRTSEIAALDRQTQSAAEAVRRLRGAAEDAESAFADSRRERERLAGEVTRLESDVRTAELAEREAQAGGESHRLRLAEIEAELGMLVSQFAQNPASDAECRDVEERYRGEPDILTEELPRLREDLSRLANVNLNAESDREALAERDRFLREQLEDLARARAALLESIREIEEQTQEQFNRTFEAVAAAFAAAYGQLFPGGEARMWQTNPDNLSETGIEIAAQPPGKKSMPLAALSGGERAMTAAALIFALIKVRPAPFYLLDEVDAALDDANVERFSAMVRELSTDSQIVLVTHNKQTMELADRMYGLTMAEAGVSTVVSAALTERETREAAIA